MCPDRETISAFIDNEVPREFSIKISDHLSNCLLCACSVDEISKISTECRKISLDIEASKTTVWNNIRNKLDYKKPAPFWNRKISVPVPVLAAAAAVFIAVTAFSVINLFIASNLPGYSGISVIESMPITGEDDYNFFQYDQILDVDLKLPANTLFIISGTPQLIKEVDYLNISR